MGCCDKAKESKDQTTLKSQTTSFELILHSGSSVTVKDRSTLEAQAMLTRLGGGALKSA